MSRVQNLRGECKVCMVCTRESDGEDSRAFLTNERWKELEGRKEGRKVGWETTSGGSEIEIAAKAAQMGAVVLVQGFTLPPPPSSEPGGPSRSEAGS